MCFDLDSLPPVPAIAGAAVSHDDVVLEASDGNRFAAFAVRPDDASDTGVVVLPDVRGLYRFYEELALRLGERGFPALAIDYFGRTAGIAKRDNDWDYMTEVQKTRPETIQADVRAAVEYLRSPEGGSCRSIFTIGFCFGGRQSWLAAAGGHDLAGAIGFYGFPGISPLDGSPGPVQRAAGLEAPILALQAGADDHIGPAANEEFEQALQAAGADYELVTYEGAPHSFFDRTQEQHADASADAWARVLAFIDRHR